MAGASQERTARKALGQQGCWCWWGVVGAPLWPVIGARVRPGGVQGPGWGEPLVPAEGEGAVDQGLVATDGTGGADLEVGPAQFVLDLLVALLDPRPQAVETDDFGEVGGRVRAGGGVGCIRVGQVGGQAPGGLLRQPSRVSGSHDQAARGVGTVVGQAGVGGPPGLNAPVAEVTLHRCPVTRMSGVGPARARAGTDGGVGLAGLGPQVPRCGLSATT